MKRTPQLKAIRIVVLANALGVRYGSWFNKFCEKHGCRVTREKIRTQIGMRLTTVISVRDAEKIMTVYKGPALQVAQLKSNEKAFLAKHTASKLRFTSGHHKTK